MTINGEDLRIFEPFESVSEKELKWFIERAEYRELKEGEFLFKKGEPADEMFLVLDGEGVFYLEQNGERRDIGGAKRGAITGLLPYSRLTHASGNGVAVSPLKLLVLHRKHIRDLIVECPEITTGVNYRKLDVPGMDQFTGAGVYYGAATTEASACQDSDVYIVGGGNSAGQGAVYLSKFARKVHICIRKPDLSSSMSQYLIDQINSIENIEVLGQTEIAEAHGGDRLDAVTVKYRESGKIEKVPAGALFVFIGARPYTEWLSEDFKRDSRGFLLTGRDLMNHETYKRDWLQERDPFTLETSVPGIFAAGDVRSGAMNRVSSAVGEGAMSISLVHQYLSEY